MKINRARQTGAEKKTRRKNFWRRVLGILLMLLAAVPMLGGGVQAIWVLPAAVCICMNEDVYFSMFAGLCAGLCIDLACGSPLGANAIYMVCVCTFTSLLFRNLLRRSFLNYLVVTLVSTFLRAGAAYFLTQVLFGKADRAVMWREIYLPSSVLTLIVALPMYLIYLPLTKLLTKQVKSMDAAAIHRDE